MAQNITEATANSGPAPQPCSLAKTGSNHSNRLNESVTLALPNHDAKQVEKRSATSLKEEADWQKKVDRYLSLKKAFKVMKILTVVITVGVISAVIIALLVCTPEAVIALIALAAVDGLFIVISLVIKALKYTSYKHLSNPQNIYKPELELAYLEDEVMQHMLQSGDDDDTSPDLPSYTNISDKTISAQALQAANRIFREDISRQDTQTLKAEKPVYLSEQNRYELKATEGDKEVTPNRWHLRIDVDKTLLWRGNLPKGADPNKYIEAYIQHSKYDKKPTVYGNEKVGTRVYINKAFLRTLIYYKALNAKVSITSTGGWNEESVREVLRTLGLEIDEFDNWDSIEATLKGNNKNLKATTKVGTKGAALTSHDDDNRINWLFDDQLTKLKDLIPHQQQGFHLYTDAKDVGMKR